MPRNIEIKARITSVDALEPMAASLATQGPTEIAQDDTFFCCQSGRLKLRTFSATEGELIFYQRANERGPKEVLLSDHAFLGPSAAIECVENSRVSPHCLSRRT